MLVSVSNFESALSHLRGWRGRRLGSDTEATGLSWATTDVMVGVSVWCADFGYYFPFRHSSGNLPIEYLPRLLRELEQQHLVNFNAKYDLHILHKDGMQWPVSSENSHLLSHLANENEEAMDLKFLSARHLGADFIIESNKLDALLAERELDKGGIAKLAAHEVAEYCIADARLAIQLADFQWKRLAAWRLTAIAKEIAVYERITFAMEERGLLIDLSVVQALEDRATPALQTELATLAEFAGRPLNPRSSKQVCALLNIPSSADEILEVCRHPMAPVVRRARKWATMRSNYCEPYRRFVGTDGALHPNYNLGGTVAGRPSVADPNLMAVARSDEVYRVKDCFIARPGYTLLSADYSQAELRLGAHYTSDPEMIRILTSGGDVHGATAIKLGIERDYAKRINFGIVYGLGGPGLSKQLRIPLDEANRLIRTWNRGFPKFKAARNTVVKMAEEHGYIRMWTGRVRRFNTRRAPPHKAFSNLIQGGVAEMLRHAICRLSNIGQDVHPLLQVYDQVLFEVPTPIIKPVAAEVRNIMENFSFVVRPKVDLSAGQVWGRLEKVA